MDDFSSVGRHRNHLCDGPGIALGGRLRTTIQSAFALGLAAFGLATAADAQTITEPAAFASAIASVRAEAHPADEFAEPAKLPIEGQTFRLTMTAASGLEGHGNVVYNYKEGSLIIDASPTKVWPTRIGPKESLSAFNVTDNTKNLGSFVGQNAYGTKANVSVFENISTAIAILSGPKPMPSPIRASLGGGLLEDTDWWVKLELPPAEAKAVANDVVGVVEGRYGRLPSGKAGSCLVTGVSATIDRPASYSTETCYVGAHIDRIALVRKSSGEVIKEWTNENSPRLGPVLWGKIQVGMNKTDLAFAYPAATGPGSLESENIRLNFKQEVVSSVEVGNWPAKDRALAKLLTQKYGKPIGFNCVGSCTGKWKVSDEVSVYMTSLSVIYQLTSAKPPIGYYGKE